MARQKNFLLADELISAVKSKAEELTGAMQETMTMSFIATVSLEYFLELDAAGQIELISSWRERKRQAALERLAKSAKPTGE